jgi:Tfp pilus assembly protein PilN
MINLLPPRDKETIIYAHRNTRLRAWITALFVSVLVIAGTVAVGQLYMQGSINTYAAQVDQGHQQLEAQNLTTTQNQVKDLTNSLKLLVQVLSRQILFSKLLSQIGAALPSGAVLTDLSISAAQTGIDLRASVVDYQTATQVQINLQDPNNKIFDKADIVNVQCQSDNPNGQVVEYPCTVQIRALFAANNPFLFITKGAGS